MLNRYINRYLKSHNKQKKTYSNLSYNYKIYFKNLDLLFIDTPKCACSTLKRIFILNEMGFTQTVIMGVGHGTWQQLFPKLIVEDNNIPNARNKLAIIRNPYHRIISAFKNIYQETMKKEEDFQAFVRLLPELATAPPNRIALNHFKPCSWFYEGINNLTILKLEEFEKIEHYMKELKIRDDLIAGVGHENATEYSKELFSFDEEMLSIIKNIYSKDFELGNYEIHEKELVIWK